MLKDKKQRIVVTGGRGFIGGFLIAALAARGYNNIIVTSFDTTDYPAIKGVIRKDDIVVHLAWSCIPATSETNKEDDIKRNLIGTINLLDVCKEQGAKKFIFMSSGGTVYGSSEKRRQRESSPTTPKNFYGALKLAVEKYIGVYHHLYGLNFVIIRLANAYGRMQLGAQQQWAVDSFFRNAVQGQPILIRGDGETTRDYIYIDDVVDFVIMAIENSSISGVYNLGTGVGTSLNQLVKIIGGIVKKPLKLNYSPSRNFDLDYIVLSIKKALATGWEPKFNLQKGIADIYNKYEKNR